ncbi:MAG: hypothetical protein HFF04_05570 [Oscillospiraceae bacterium]|nr:hypothetical protein [Oscillospiraceae bacterium]
MKKKAILIIVVSLLAVMALHLRKEQKNEPTPGRAIITAQYTNDQGDELNVYVCKAVYAEGETRKLTALELAYKEIIDPSTAEETYTYKVYGVTAMLYKKEGRGYLCWATSDDVSTVIDYDPESVTEEEVFLMMKSSWWH